MNLPLWLQEPLSRLAKAKRQRDNAAAAYFARVDAETFDFRGTHIERMELKAALTRAEMEMTVAVEAVLALVGSEEVVHG